MMQRKPTRRPGYDYIDTNAAKWTEDRYYNE